MALKKKMDKRAQTQISFSMIFSIIIIVSVIAVAFFTINYFLNLNECTKSSLFYEDLQDQITSAWKSSAGYSDTFTSQVPSSVKSICIGDINSNSSSQKFRTELQELKRFQREGNLFLYPPGSSCQTAYKLQHIESVNFFCTNVTNGKVSIKIKKTSNSPVCLGNDC